jgi:TfoX N-terminal domain
VGYDEDLAYRLRGMLGDERGVTEMKMFGGLAFLINGNMAVSASRQGGLLLRVPPEETDALLRRPHAVPFEMKGKEMDGWLRVVPDGIDADEDLEGWVAIGVRYARSLAAKKAKR